MNEYVSVRDAAQRKGVSTATIYKAIEERRLPATQMLGRWALLTSDVEAFAPGSYAGVKRATISRRAKSEAAPHA